MILPHCGNRVRSVISKRVETRTDAVSVQQGTTGRLPYIDVPWLMPLSKQGRKVRDTPPYVPVDTLSKARESLGIP